MLKQVRQAVVSFTLAAQLGMPCCLPHWQLSALRPPHLAVRLGLSNAFNWHILAVDMEESLASITWQETVDTAVTRLEEKTGLSLSGLSQLEISLQVREWMKAKAESRLPSEIGNEVL